MPLQSLATPAPKNRTEDTLIAQAVADYVLKNFSETITLDDLAETVGCSPYKVCRAFFRASGVTPMRWLWAFRINLAAEFVAYSPDRALTEIAFFCGFNSSAHFSQSFVKAFGVSPTDYRRASLAAGENPTVASPDLLQLSAQFLAKAAAKASA